MVKKKFAFAAGAAALVAAFVPATAQAILGGTPVKDSPSFHGQLVFKKESLPPSEDGQPAEQDKLNCGVVLVAQEWAVTNASCVTKFEGDTYPYDEPTAYKVRLGSRKVHSGGTVVYVTEIVKHKGWDAPTGENDIALLKLDRSVDIEPATIAEPDPEQPAVQIGWGTQSADEPKKSSTVLREAEAQLLEGDDPRCVTTGGDGNEKPYFADQQTCQAADLQEGIGVTCYGDTGSPALQVGKDEKPVVISIASRGGCPKNGQPGHPDISVRLAAYEGWMTSVMNGK